MIPGSFPFSIELGILSHPAVSLSLDQWSWHHCLMTCTPLRWTTKLMAPAMKSGQDSADSAVGHRVQTDSVMKLHQLFTWFPPHSFPLCDPVHFHGSSCLACLAFMTLNEKVDLLCPPARVQIQVCITSMKVCYKEILKSCRESLWIQEILLAQSSTFLSVALDHQSFTLISFDFPDLVRFSQTHTDNQNTQIGRNNFMCQASKQNAHNFLN